MRIAIGTLIIMLCLVACNRENGNGKTATNTNAAQVYLDDPLILPIAKAYYQGKKPVETVETLDMLDSLFIQDSIRLRFYFAATTKLIGQEMNFRDIVSLYAFKFVRDRPLQFIAQFTEDNPLLDTKTAWDVWCLNVGYEAMMKDPESPFAALDAIEQSMKNRFRTVSPNAMEMGATFISTTRSKIIKLQHEQKQPAATPKQE